MKTRKFTIPGGTLLIIALMAMFSSCSRELTNLNTNSKMQYAQTIAKTHSESQDIKQKDVSVPNNDIIIDKNYPVVTGNDVQLCKTSVSDIKEPLKGNIRQKSSKIMHPRVLKTVASLALPILITAKQQLASAPVSLQKSNTLSHKQTFLSGYLRTAVICFIVALICTVLAWIIPLFWILATIFWVIGAVFLLLWLLGNV